MAVSGVAYACVGHCTHVRGAAELPSREDSGLLSRQVCCLLRQSCVIVYTRRWSYRTLILSWPQRSGDEEKLSSSCLSSLPAAVVALGDRSHSALA